MNRKVYRFKHRIEQILSDPELVKFLDRDHLAAAINLERPMFETFTKLTEQCLVDHGLIVRINDHVKVAENVTTVHALVAADVMASSLAYILMRLFAGGDTSGDRVNIAQIGMEAFLCYAIKAERHARPPLFDVGSVADILGSLDA